MARSMEEDCSRRLGRVEMLLMELKQLPDGYQPTEREVEQFAALLRKIDQVFGPVEMESSELAASWQEIADLKAQYASLLEAYNSYVPKKPEAPAAAPEPAPEKKGKGR